MPGHLTPEQYESLMEALCTAFPTSPDLRRMVLFGLGERLDEIVTARDNLRNQAFELIEWVHSHGKIDLLIEGACKQNPGNPDLQAFVEQFRLHGRLARRLAPFARPAREYPFPETWKCDLSMIEDCVEELDQPGVLFGFAVSCNCDAFRESFCKRLEHVLGRGKIDVIAPYTLSRLDTTDILLKHASRIEQLKDKLRYRDLLCCVKLASDIEQIVEQQASALWQALRTIFQGNYDHRLIVVLFTQVEEFALPDGIVRLAPPRFKPVHVIEWVQDFASALGWDDRFLAVWKKIIIKNSIVHSDSPRSLDVELVYSYLDKSLQLLSAKPPPTPHDFLDQLY